MSDFFTDDEPIPFLPVRCTPSVDELSAAAEEADDQYRKAVIDAANAKADYELAVHQALVEADGTSQAARQSFAEGEALKERRTLLISEAVEKASKVHVQVVLGRLSAAQTGLRFQARQDGGDF